MTKTTTIRLVGTGAAYIRVSTDQQDTERQYTAIGKFEEHHGAKIGERHWFKDEGWARDTADTRPEFQRLMKLAEDKKVQWIVVDALDRFGTKNAKQLVAYLYRLDNCGCKLFDASGREWTGEDIATVITAVVEGDKSRGEQVSKSYRILSGQAAKARAGEWMGGPPRFGFDVACYSRETDKELWRVVFEGARQRVKVYPDGTTKRFDGEGNFPAHQITEVMRVTPSKDKGKVDAAVNIFKRYATEAITFAALAKYLNAGGYRSAFGGMFQSHHIRLMLGDPVFIGYYTWNKRHQAKFHRLKGGVPVQELNYDERDSDNDPADWVQSERSLFKPLVDSKTWAAVQAKLRKPKRGKAPISPALYLSGLLHCGNCGGPMVARSTFKGRKREYFCGTYHRAIREGRLGDCRCLRNGVSQDTLDEYVTRYLEESGRRLDFLTERVSADPLTSRLEADEDRHWGEFIKGIERLAGYLIKHHPDEYAAIIKEHSSDAEDAPGPDDLVAAIAAAYRRNFDPAAVAAEIEKLEAEHSIVAKRWTDLPTPRAKEKAKKELEELELRIGELEKQRDDAAGVVEDHRREVANLQKAIADAKIAMRSEKGERALRQKAEAIRAVVHRIDLEFVATGVRGGGPGKSNSRLAVMTIHTVSGEEAVFRTGPANVIPRSPLLPRDHGISEDVIPQSRPSSR